MILSIQKADFLGRQLARLRYAQQYLGMVFQMMTALGIFKLALGLSNSEFFYLIGFGMVGYWIFGYILHKNKIKSKDAEQDFMLVRDPWKKMMAGATEAGVIAAIIKLKQEKWI